MSEALQIMLLPPSAGDGLPQVLLEDGGIWRETSTPQGVVVTQTEVRKDIEQHLSGVMQKVGGNPPVPVPPENPGFKNRFRVRFQDLLPIDVRNALTRVAEAAEGAGGPPPLLQIFLKPGLEWIPWELLHDGTRFLGLRFAVARLPILREALDMRGVRQRQVSSVYSLLARNVLEPAALVEWQTTFAGYVPNGGWEHRYPSDGADYPSLTQLEEAQQADIVHVTCHGGLRDNNNNYCWTLDHLNVQVQDYRIDPDFARMTPLGKRPLVFGNACASIATKADDLGAMHGFGSNFMIGGALNFVGTFAPITKTMAVTFAKRFYQQLLGTPGGAAGLPIAQALLNTKRSFIAEGCPDPSYLFYCLYGPPDSTYTPGG